ARSAELRRLARDRSGNGLDQVGVPLHVGVGVRRADDSLWAGVRGRRRRQHYGVRLAHRKESVALPAWVLDAGHGGNDLHARWPSVSARAGREHAHCVRAAALTTSPRIVGMFVSKKHVVVFLCVLLPALCVGSSAQVRTPDQMLINPDPKDWVTYGGTYNSHRYSPLKQVTTANASRLQVKWVYHLNGTEELEFTPIVLNGVMYVSGFNRVDALDTRTGNIIWKYQRQPPSTARQRGTAVYGDKVYVATSDSHLVALDARTGGVRW